MKSWNSFLSYLEKKIGSTNVDKWLRPLKVVKFDAGNLYLEASDSIQSMWFHEHIEPIARKTLTNQNGRPIYVHIYIRNKPAKDKKRQNLSNLKNKNPTFKPDPLEQEALFANYICTEKNKVAYKILSELTGYRCESRSYQTPNLHLSEFNPIYLHGGKGSGKTHLLMSTAQGLQKQNFQVLYVQAETFTDHVIQAFRMGYLPEFRMQYRNVDVLIIDDIHLLAKKNSTQEELFHTFNALHTNGKQIIFSSTQPPRMLKDIEERLISRFEWGLTLPLVKLDPQGLKCLLQKRCQKLHFPLNNEVMHFLLEQFPNAKSLIASVEALVLRSHLENRTFTNTSEVQKILHDLIEKERKASLTPERILSMVAQFFDINPQDILSASRKKECTFPRQIAMYLCRTELNMPYPKIGSVFARDHSTVMSSIKMIANGIHSKNPRIATTISNLHRQVVNL